MSWRPNTSGFSFTPKANTIGDLNNYIDIDLPLFATLGDVNVGSTESAQPRIGLSGSLFAAAGLIPGDIIMQIDDAECKNLVEFYRLINDTDNREIVLKILRDTDELM